MLRWCGARVEEEIIWCVAGMAERMCTGNNGALLVACLTAFGTPFIAPYAIVGCSGSVISYHQNLDPTSAACMLLANAQQLLQPLQTAATAPGNSCYCPWKQLLQPPRTAATAPDNSCCFCICQGLSLKPLVHYCSQRCGDEPVELNRWRLQRCEPLLPIPSSNRTLTRFTDACEGMAVSRPSCSGWHCRRRAAAMSVKSTNAQLRPTRNPVYRAIAYTEAGRRADRAAAAGVAGAKQLLRTPGCNHPDSR